MKRMDTVPIGAHAELDLLVTGEYAVDFMANESARVLATPFLIAYLELAARDAAAPYLEAGSDTVGTMVQLNHLAATPLGLSVRFHAEVTGAGGRKIQYRIWAEDEIEKVAEGTHERFVIDVKRFGDRVRRKALEPRG